MDFPGVALYGKLNPMEEIGGDFYDLIKLREESLLGIFISDVSGHGIPAALITSMVKTLIETSGINRFSPNDLLTFINDKISNQLSGNFLTAFYGIYNAETRIFKYARASHNPPVVVRGDKIIELNARGKMLGLNRLDQFEEIEFPLEINDKVLFYTDGLVETISPDGEDFSEKFYEFLLKNSHLNIKDLIELLYEDLLKFHQDSYFEDDICILGMHIQK
jgi:serine phosphatase RsbU (regulator of sigma subunit)